MSVSYGTDSVRLRRAVVTDVENIRRCAEAAYQLYVERIGKPPAPMIDDFHARVQARDVRIAEHAEKFAGFAIFEQRDQSLFLENIAVLPSVQGLGIGKAMLNYLERLSDRAGLDAIELYTNAKMTENLTLYPSLGYEQVGRKTEAGFDRVYFRKPTRVGPRKN